MNTEPVILPPVDNLLDARCAIEGLLSTCSLVVRTDRTLRGFIDPATRFVDVPNDDFHLMQTALVRCGGEA